MASRLERRSECGLGAGGWGAAVYTVVYVYSGMIVYRIS